MPSEVTSTVVTKDTANISILQPETVTLLQTTTKCNNSVKSVCDDPSIERPLWKRLNHKGVFHDNRRLLKHRARNCECFVCYREIYKLPPAESHEEYVSRLKSQIKEKEIKRAKRFAKKEVKVGKQLTINSFYKDKSRIESEP